MMALRKQLLAEDTEAALIGPFLSSEQRECFFTLRALNAETARVIDGARGNAHMAAVRFRFWSDIVRAAFRSDAAALEHPHPFARQLRAVVRGAKSPMSERLLLRSIEAREAASDSQRQSQTIEDTLQYARDTQSSLLFLCLQHAGIDGDEATEAAADHLGQAMGVATLLRSMPHLHARGEIQHIPAEAMEHRGLTPELYQVGLERKAPKEGASEQVVERYEAFRQQVRDVAFDLAVAGHDQMQAAFAHEGKVDKGALGLLLPAVTTARTYRLLEEHNFDPWSEELAQALAPSRHQLAISAELARHWIFGKWC